MESDSTIEIVPLSSEHGTDIINFLMSSFFLQEPLNAKLQFKLPDEPMTWAVHIVEGSINDQCSFVAIDTTTPNKNVVGVILNGITDRTQEQTEFVTPSEKLNFIFSIIDKVSHGHDLFEKYETDRLFHCDVININENQRGQKLSIPLITASLDKARQLGIKGASVVCTSLYSRKAFERQGFKVINEILYSQLGDERLTNMDDHARCTLLGTEIVNIDD
ncbi:unnamed protein product [Adineta steineri]|uniref:aralkylamine N-acetyltransferase n=1 Tax=Adineta steineri TaxID=433720 RepID=A0A820BCJ1_9BILA|nr:unnamed protein product [Adineta steineri]CAF4205603.1 unnamed protein product [Adineta steineri]